MSSETPLTRRASLAWGIVLVAASLAMCLLVYSQPQHLHAPAWVAFAACGAFGFAGLVLLARAAASQRTQNWLAVGLTLTLVLPGLWVAFGTGQRECTVSLPFLQFGSSALCRGAFGIGSVLGIVILVLYIRHAIILQRKS